MRLLRGQNVRGPEYTKLFQHDEAQEDLLRAGFQVFGDFLKESAGI